MKGCLGLLSEVRSGSSTVLSTRWSHGCLMALSKEELLSQARAWGFCCELDEQGESVIRPQEGNWRILSRPSVSNLGNGESRWLLVVDGSSQISFYPEDVLKFLKQRRRS